MRVAAALEAFVSSSAIAVIAVALALTVAKVWPSVAARWVRDAIAGGALSVIAATSVAASRRLPKFAGAMALDVHHRFADRLTNALSFASLPSSARSPLMEIAIDDACARAEGLSPRAAVPLRRPRDLGALFGLSAGVFLLAVLEVRIEAEAVHVKTIDPVSLSADDIDLFREIGKKLAETDKSPEVLAALQAYNQLVEDLAGKRLDRTEAFRRMNEIESKLMEGRALDVKELEEQLKMRAASLKKSELSRPLAEALEKQDLAKAEREMRDLAKKLREEQGAQKKEQLEKLREAMKKAAEGQKERLAALDQRREELLQQLLRQKQNGDGGVDEQQQSLLQKKERELERLDREKGDQERAGRKLDRLDRDLAQAAEDIMRELGMTADDLDKGAEDINRMAQEKMSDEEREELRQRLEDLREQLRQEGQGGQQQKARLRRFLRQARGHDKQGGQAQKQNCPAGDPNCQPDQGQGEGEEEGKREGDGHDQNGQTLTLGPGGQKILTLSRGRGLAPGQGPSGQPDQPGGQGQPGGPEGDGKDGRLWGRHHDPNVAGKESTHPKMGTMDVQAAGVDTGQGKSRSEVILGAAEKGFRGGGYKKVYTEYRTSAEEQIHQDKVPPGANDHIRRYFDLIRPRE